MLCLSELLRDSSASLHINNPPNPESVNSLSSRSASASSAIKSSMGSTGLGWAAAGAKAATCSSSSSERSISLSESRLDAGDSLRSCFEALQRSSSGFLLFPATAFWVKLKMQTIAINKFLIGIPEFLKITFYIAAAGIMNGD